MFFKRLMAVVLTMAMLCSMIAFAEDTAGVLISPNPAAGETTQPVLTQEEINKNATGFIDISPDAEYAAAVKKLVEFGIIAGYPDGTFKPDGEVTRAEMCKMINLTLGYTDFEGAAGFSDVSNTNWYYAYALAAQKQGYVEGYEDGTFRGSNNITRQEVCAILNRLLKPMNLGIPVTINDPVANWARPHVEIIVQNFIMPLEENNTFRATENLKRHELATVLSNMAIGPVQQIDADVRFFVNGEQYGETQTVTVGNTATAPEDPQTPGSEYVFDGWRQIGTDGVVDVNSVIVVADVDYEAVFVKKLHDVTFYSRGAVYDTRVVEHDDFVEAPENPEVKGYEFLGWLLSEDGNAVKLSETKIQSDVNFYALFEKSESGAGGGSGGTNEETFYNVKFFVNGDLYETQKILKNKTPETPEEPFREGYSFLGWSLQKDGELVEPTSIRVTKAVTLYAVFEKEEEDEPEVFTVNFYVNGKKYDTQFVQYGNKPSSVVNPLIDGYIFKYWSKTEGGSEVKLGYYSVTSNVDFYAVFEKEAEEVKYFSVTFMVDGEEYSSSKVAEGNKASAPTAPSKDGYNFKGWSKTDGGSVSSVSVAVTSDLTFYAIFEKKEAEKKTYTITFVVDGKTVASSEIIEGTAVNVPNDPEKADYNFLGWSKTSGGSVIDVSSVVINANTTFYAVFEKNPVYFEVVFIVDGDEYDVQEVLEGEYPEVPNDPVLEGYEFLGWSKTEGGSTVYPERTAVKADTAYYAVFQETEEEIIYYNVAFWFDGEVLTFFEAVAGDTVKAPTIPELETGVSFLGWSLDDNGAESDVIEVSDIVIEEHTDFYAVLIKNPNDPELMEKLERGYSQLSKIRATGLQREAINIIKECVEYVIADAKSGKFIDKAYVRKNYEDMVDEVRVIVNETMTSTERSSFVNTITNTRNIDKDVQDFLIDYFDIDTSI